MKVQVVHGSAGEDGKARYWARIRGENNETVWVTETYTSPETAYQAVQFLVDGFGGALTGAADGAFVLPFGTIEEVFE